MWPLSFGVQVTGEVVDPVMQCVQWVVVELGFTPFCVLEMPAVAEACERTEAWEPTEACERAEACESAEAWEFAEAWELAETWA